MLRIARAFYQRDPRAVRAIAVVADGVDSGKFNLISALPDLERTQINPGLIGIEE
jgi:hypothetical protein